jgi:hypothetical protein
MRNELEAQHGRPPIVRKVGAGIVLLVAAAIAVDIVIHVVLSVLTFVAVIAVAVAVIWALKELVW